MASSLRIHRKTHEPRQTCEICGSSVSASLFKVHVQMHELRKHGAKFECEICPKKFYMKKDLSQHRKAHDKKYKCDLCCKRFAFKQHIRKHMLVHLVARPFECKSCTSTFKCQIDVRRHAKKVHKSKKTDVY
jgi:KRAB domain-containing zinc finger protein